MTTSKILKKVSFILLALIVFLSCFMLTGCANDEVGISWQRGFSANYVLNENYIENTKSSEYHSLGERGLTIFKGAVVVYRYKDGNTYKQRYVDLDEAYYYTNNPSAIDEREFKDKILLTGFAVNSITKNGSETTRPMTIKFLPGDSTTAEYTLAVNYAVYETSDALDSAENVLKFLNGMNSVLTNILVPIIIVVCAAGGLFAIFLGINVARASSSEQREEAKKRVIACIVAIVIGIVLVVLFQSFAHFSITWFGDGAFFTV